MGGRVVGHVPPALVVPDHQPQELDVERPARQRPQPSSSSPTPITASSTTRTGLRGAVPASVTPNLRTQPPLLGAGEGVVVGSVGPTGELDWPTTSGLAANAGFSQLAPTSGKYLS